MWGYNFVEWFYTKYILDYFGAVIVACDNQNKIYHCLDKDILKKYLHSIIITARK